VLRREVQAGAASGCEASLGNRFAIRSPPEKIGAFSGWRSKRKSFGIVDPNGTYPDVV
jgi:hypothetical protein